MSAERPLDGAIAIVTGALGNLGPVWSRALAEAGAAVVGVDVREGDAPHCSSLARADVTDRGELQEVRRRVESELGTPSVLVNNAGIDSPPEQGEGEPKVEDLSLDGFRRTVETNLTGTFNATQVFGAAMRDAGRGSIVNIGSLYATIAPEPAFYEHMGFLKHPSYGASKAGVLSLTRYFARLWGPHGVRVNALSPGGVLAGQDSEFLAKYTARVPLRRLAEADDLTGPIVFLASEASRYLTGHELRVDGGFTA